MTAREKAEAVALSGADSHTNRDTTTAICTENAKENEKEKDSRSGAEGKQHDQLEHQHHHQDEQKHKHNHGRLNLNPELFVVEDSGHNPRATASASAAAASSAPGRPDSKSASAPAPTPGSGSDAGAEDRNADADDDDDDDSGDGDGNEYPEGGLRAWLVVLGSWMALVSSLGLMNTIATFQSYVSEHQLSSYSEGTIGWIFSLYTFLAFFLGIYIGPIFDKYGPRWLILSGTVLLAVGTMVVSICTEYWHFMLAFGLTNGLATALLFTPSIAAIGHFFRRRRGLATGVASTGGGVGGVAFPLLLQALIPRVGWAWAVRALGLVCVLLAAGSNLLIRSRLPPAGGASAHPDWRILRSRAFALTTLGIFLMEFALFIPLGYISLYARSAGLGEGFSFQVLTVLNAASVVGRALPGWWADIIGPSNANILAIVQSIVACLAVWLPAGQTTAGLVVFAILFGFASGTNISLAPVCIGRLCKTQEYGRYYSTCYTVASLACLVGLPIGGNIIAACGGQYWGLILFTGLVYCASLVAFVVAKAHIVGWKPWTVF